MPWYDKDAYDDKSKDADWFEEVEEADVGAGRELKTVEEYLDEYRY